MLHLTEEAARCLLCHHAPCGEKTARAIRALRFENLWTATEIFSELTDAELRAAEDACIHYDKPIRISELKTACLEKKRKETKEQVATDNTTKNALPSLEINFCDMVCENPFFLASSAICTNYDMVSRALEAGWAGVFYKTISKQEIREVSPRFDAVGKEGTPFVGFRNMEQLSENPYQTDFEILHRLKQNYPTKIIIASIMGQTEEEWIELAKMAQDAGCDAVELNFSCPQMRLTGLGSDIGQNPELILFYTSYVKNAVSIPVIPKMTPNIMSMTSPALACFYAGANGISAINTIKSITMSNAATVSGKKTISGYSGKAVKPIALRMVYEMTGNPILYNAGIQKHMDISGIGGIETWRDALDFIQLGCRNVQVCTAVMQYGYRIIDDLKLGMQHYMQQRGITELKKLVGEEIKNFVLPSDLDRDTMVFPMIDRTKCIGCGRCYVSCMDGGHQAISFDTENNGQDLRKPRIIGQKCVGCHLCRLVCPTGAIGMAKRMNKK
ncbi:MAG: NAD-dependent dihydropyrimidine dehydrogenase subunit PreA [Paludibacteraceae bacterium]|nr:NAD-dependent dihydropyrimidine dehydrogenase subunit PreA [Paludibacteraceae bacterium]